MLTGERCVLRADIMMDAGNSLSPAIDAGQVCPIPLFELLSCKVLTFHCCLGYARRVVHLRHSFIGVMGSFAVLLCPSLQCCPNFGYAIAGCYVYRSSTLPGRCLSLVCWCRLRVALCTHWACCCKRMSPTTPRGNQSLTPPGTTRSHLPLAFPGTSSSACFRFVHTWHALQFCYMTQILCF